MKLKNSFLLAIAACCLLVVGQAHAVYQVEIEADKSVRGLLEEHLEIKRYQDKEDLNPDQFRFLLMGVKKQVQDLLATEGYFSPVIDVSFESARVLIRVETGAPIKIVEVNLELSGEAEEEHPPRIDRMRKYWRLPVGARFRQADWDEAKNRLMRRLQERRYPSARIEASEAQIEPSAKEAALWVNYDSGPVFNFGALAIEGLKRYPSDIIHHMNPLVVGEEYSTERLLELQRQIQSTPYFSQVNVSVEPNRENAKYAPVNVQVKEFPVQHWRAGGGYASDTGAHLESRYTNLNVFKRAWVANTELKLEQTQQSGQFELAMPPDERSYINSTNFLFQRTHSAGLDVRSAQASIKRSRQLEKYKVSLSLDYFLDTLTRDNSDVALASSVPSDSQHRAMMLAVAWSRRDIDNPVFPREGNLLSIQSGFAVKGLLADESFFRFYTKGRQYLSLTRNDTFIFRGEAGSVITKGGENKVPASLLFRTGGTDTVRGYGYQHIGNNQDGTIYPTKFVLSGGVEYQHWLANGWGGAVFFDAGCATNNWSDRNFYQGLGLGARWKSPIGPVNLDIAYGVRDRAVRPHISLGVAF